ncbi:DMT(drug/metabolite transporter) superfamily permease [Desulfocapsa sulfexigens DSM 10523]|uniref:DMT(Drug/metabolite transporter) superfamily permease n=1 Tax=Desulfocapsa sulfexigens (strain DSM 10523 / SB164P1) TaxID=1167006 RepID=M1P8M9_DESSD|nr:DMT family transporter [Desulfocapsa sulfexigens]AGF77992.1 DMT(drug/metabolite transporter) superfamily permease [Desulfocapsa sulfexigens DSM 10523]
MPYLLLTLSALFWSGNFVLSRGMHAEIPPVSLAFWRWTLALLIIAPFGLRRVYEQRKLLIQHRRFMLWQGILGVAGFNTFIYLALQSTTAINAVLVNSCIPIIIVLISLLIYREPLSMRQSIGVFISLSGVLLIIAKGNINTLQQLTFNQGDLLVLVAALVWAFYSANLRHYPAGLHPITYLTGIMLTGLVFLLPCYLFEIQSGKHIQINIETILTISYVALFASILAFICWTRAIREVGANRAGPFIHLMPVFSTILAIVFLEEVLLGYHVQGMVLVFTGIFITTFSFRKQKDLS